MAKLSSPYKFHGKIFRYDFTNSLVQYLYKASPEEIQEEQEWRQKHHSSLIDIDDDGYVEVTAAGLRRENWDRKEVRDEYLAGWIEEIEEENEYLMAEAAEEFACMASAI